MSDPYRPLYPTSKGRRRTKENLRQRILPIVVREANRVRRRRGAPPISEEIMPRCVSLGCRITMTLPDSLNRRIDSRDVPIHISGQRDCDHIERGRQQRPREGAALLANWRSDKCSLTLRAGLRSSYVAVAAIF